MHTMDKLTPSGPSNATLLETEAADSDGEAILRDKSSYSLASYCDRFRKRERLKRLVPALLWIPRYSAKHLASDIVAGVSIGLMLVPQSLANAKIAHLPLQFGLYSAIMGPFVYSLLGTSKDAAIGPTAIVSLMVAGYNKDPYGNPSRAIFMAFCCGIMHVAMFFLNLGFIVQFIPLPVISAFMSAGAVIIINAQLKSWLGLSNIRSGFFESAYDSLRRLPQARPWDGALGVVCMVALVVAKHVKERLLEPLLQTSAPASGGATDSPLRRAALRAACVACAARNAVVILLASSVAAGLGAGMDGDGGAFVQVRGVPHGLPDFRSPTSPVEWTPGSNSTASFVGPAEMLQDVGVGVLATGLVCVLEQIAVVKTFARKNGYRVETSQEILAIGLSNILGSLFGSFPVTGSMSRSAVASASGVATPAGGVVAGAVVLLALAFLTPYFVYIPQAALAAVVMVAAADIIDLAILRSLWITRRAELVPYVATFIFSLPWGIEYGILAGITVSLSMVLYPLSRPALYVYQIGGTKTDLESGHDTLPREFSCVASVVRLNPGLSFPTSDYIYDKVMKYGPLHTTPRSVILDCVHCINMDFTAIQSLRALSKQFGARNLVLILANVNELICGNLKSVRLGSVYLAKDVVTGMSLLRKLMKERQGNPTPEQKDLSSHQESQTVCQNSSSNK